MRAFLRAGCLTEKRDKAGQMIEDEEDFYSGRAHESDFGLRHISAIEPSTY
jgi:hypothetical protein